MSVVMPVGGLRVGRVSTAQLPVEHVAEGDVLGRHSTVNRDAASFHATSRYLTSGAPASGGVTAIAQRAIAEYQSFARLEKERFVPLHNVDEYV